MSARVQAVRQRRCPGLHRALIATICRSHAVKRCDQLPPKRPTAQRGGSAAEPATAPTLLHHAPVLARSDTIATVAMPPPDLHADTTPTNRERVVHLTRTSRELPDDEITRQTGISPRQQVNAICLQLAQEGALRRVPGPRGKIVNEWIGPT